MTFVKSSRNNITRFASDVSGLCIMMSKCKMRTDSNCIGLTFGDIAMPLSSFCSITTSFLLRQTKCLKTPTKCLKTQTSLWLSSETLSEYYAVFYSTVFKKSLTLMEPLCIVALIIIGFGFMYNSCCLAFVSRICD